MGKTIPTCYATCVVPEIARSKITSFGMEYPSDEEQTSQFDFFPVPFCSSTMSLYAARIASLASSYGFFFPMSKQPIGIPPDCQVTDRVVQFPFLLPRLPGVPSPPNMLYVSQSAICSIQSTQATRVHHSPRTTPFPPPHAKSGSKPHYKSPDTHPHAPSLSPYSP